MQRLSPPVSGTAHRVPDRRDLLCYAFEQAADAGKAGVWPYIEAVLGKLHSRGLKNLDDAEGYDWERL